MCGITGIWNLDNSKISEIILNEFNDSLAHRGPDGRGTYIGDNSSLGLGHRRLAILDLSNQGHQPMSYINGRYWITYNGEIYNFLELKSELEGLGYHFKSESDTEVILAAYDKWGSNCQYKFNGMWAFAIWDDKEKSLFLSRDRFGVKPLFYFYNSNYFAFASEMKAFLHLETFDTSFNYSMIKKSLNEPFKVEAIEECLFKNLKKLKAGYQLLLKKGKLPILTRWWNTLEHLEDVSFSENKQIERFKELFYDACNIRMRSDVPIGTALSGGLDSGSVLCTMAEVVKIQNNGNRLNSCWQKAFVSTYRPDNVQNEENQAKEVIKKINGIGIFNELNPLNALNDIDKIIYDYESLSTELPFGPWYIYKRMREEKIFVSLDGHGGDELLGGYIHHLNWAMRDAAWPIPNIIRMHLLRKLQKEMHPFPEMIKEVSWFNLVKKKLIMSKPENFQDLLDDQDYLNEFDSLNKGLYTDFHFTILPTLLRNYDRVSMAHGVEVRCPFLDWRLVCFAFSLPSYRKVGNFYSKSILRKSMQGILPESIRTRKSKIGFANPICDWIEHFRDYIFDTVNSSEFIKSNLWNGIDIKNKIIEIYKTKNWELLPEYFRYIHVFRYINIFKKSYLTA